LIGDVSPVSRLETTPVTLYNSDPTKLINLELENETRNPFGTFSPANFNVIALASFPKNCSKSVDALTDLK